MREEWVDKFFQLIPEEFRQFDGEFGVVDPEAKAEIVFKYIKTEIKEWMQNWYVKAWEKLISIFKKIWDLLGLDFLPISELLAIMEMDIGALIEARIKSIKDKWKNTKVAKKRKIKKLVEEIEELNKETPLNTEELDKKHAEKKKLEEELLKEM